MCQTNALNIVVVLKINETHRITWTLKCGDIKTMCAPC